LNGGYIMAIVNYSVGKELPAEKIAAMLDEVRAAAKRPYTYAPDCPLLTEAQLAEFRPVHFATEGERLAAMRQMGIADPDYVATEELTADEVELLRNAEGTA
jgi:hypothetical protein